MRSGIHESRFFLSNFHASRSSFSPYHASRINPLSPSRNLPANSMGYFCCEPFQGFEPCVSLVGGMTQLTAALMK